MHLRHVQPALIDVFALCDAFAAVRDQSLLPPLDELRAVVRAPHCDKAAIDGTELAQAEIAANIGGGISCRAGVSGGHDVADIEEREHVWNRRMSPRVGIDVDPTIVVTR